MSRPAKVSSWNLYLYELQVNFIYLSLSSWNCLGLDTKKQKFFWQWWPHISWLSCHIWRLIALEIWFRLLLLMVLEFVSRDKTSGSGRHFLLLGVGEVGHCMCIKFYKPVWLLCSKSFIAIYGSFLLNWSQFCFVEVTYAWPSLQNLTSHRHGLNPRSSTFWPWELGQTFHFTVPQLRQVVRKSYCLSGRMLGWLKDASTGIRTFLLLLASLTRTVFKIVVCIWNVIHSL